MCVKNVMTLKQREPGHYKIGSHYVHAVSVTKNLLHHYHCRWLFLT